MGPGRSQPSWHRASTWWSAAIRSGSDGGLPCREDPCRCRTRAAGGLPSDGDDLTAAGVPTLSLMAEHDGLADEADIRGGLARLPADTRLVVIDGAVHSFFGRYGPQAGDGVPTVPRAAAEAQITGELVAFFDGLG
ncbi:alpha/beta hydrolase [Tessaracoccus coleopterorum]|uniref:alpha/beta hydrolase n=1 Tax=Tessaracoccus coleopterorum TaxID=2714950 RepID=UPI002F90B9D8